MQQPLPDRSTARVLGLIAVFLATGCRAQQMEVGQSQISDYEQRMAQEQSFEPAPTLEPIPRPPPAELTGPKPTTQPAINTSIWLELPDPSVAAEVFETRLRVTRYSKSLRSEYERTYRDALASIAEISKPQKVRLSLAECLARTVANNYAIKAEGYLPAISTARIVQAEAAFDTAFFANVSRNNTDQPTPSQLIAAQTDTTIVAGGISKLLVNGAQVTLSQQMTRIDNPGFQFQTLNPSWQQNFVAEIRQPLLRNFGIDFNRAQIDINKNQRIIDQEGFRNRVIEFLNNAERAYWDLVGARRDLVIIAELLAEARLTLAQVTGRIDFDAYQALVSRSQSAVSLREFEYIQVKNRVQDAQDQLRNIMNDPEFPLAGEYEIIPTDEPTTVKVPADMFQSVQIALERRPEVIQARHVVDIAGLQLGVAKNQALPQLSVIYRATVNGLGANADSAFDQETGGNFIDQFVGMEFAWNFGERAERAGMRIAALQQSQSVVRYKQVLDNVITDCRVALRALDTSYQQLEPSHEGVTSGAENLRSLQERQERKTPPELDVTLNAQINLAQSRRALLQALVAYNQGIVDVERAKGTLLEYDNVVLPQKP